MPKTYSGRCACGAVKFQFDADPTFIADCYCLDCQKASGGVMATFFGVPESAFTLLSGNPRSFSYIADSGKRIDRNFCPECGSRLFSNNSGAFPDTVFVMIGSLDRPDGIQPVLEMYTKRRYKWLNHLDVPQFQNMPT
ncbi:MULTISPECIES: GFA family protein [unclassified Paraburkholderia]|uniref:GFA family protein n=1 Tax=unclassified Paraburkholderia TaxID=2615204 RepID=UPI0034CE8637